MKKAVRIDTSTETPVVRITARVDGQEMSALEAELVQAAFQKGHPFLNEIMDALDKIDELHAIVADNDARIAAVGLERDGNVLGIKTGSPLERSITRQLEEANKKTLAQRKVHALPSGK